MSLINQMLKDLESRRTPEPQANEILPGTSGMTAGSRVTPLLLFALLIVLLLLSGALLYLWQQNSRLQATVTPPAEKPAVIQRTREQGPTTADSGTEPSMPAEEKVRVKTKPLLQGEEEVVVTVRPLATVPEAEEDNTTTTTTTPSVPNRPKSPRAAVTATEAQPMTPPSREEDKGEMHKVIHPPSKQQLAEQRYQQGYQALQQHQSERAEGLWQEALGEAPEHERARKGLITLYLSQGRKIEAAKLLEEGLEQQPGNPRYAMLLARLQAEQGRRAEAIENLQRAMQQNPQQAELFALAAALQQQLRDYGNSIEAYRQALQLQPQQSRWWMGLGISLEGASKPAEARSAFEQALQRGGLNGPLKEYVQQRLQALE